MAEAWHRCAESTEGPRRQLFAGNSAADGSDHGHILGQPAANPPTTKAARTKQQADSAQVEDGSNRAENARERCAQDLALRMSVAWGGLAPV